MNFSKFKDWALLSLLGCGVWILYDLKQSVDTLNVSVAVVIEKTTSHEKRIDRLEEKIEDK